MIALQVEAFYGRSFVAFSFFTNFDELFLLKMGVREESFVGDFV